MMLTLMLTSKGVAAVPRASLVILSGTLAQFGLPLEGVAVILGVDALMDMARTSVNLVGNCLATVVMARWEGEFELSSDGHAGRRRAAGSRSACRRGDGARAGVSQRISEVLSMERHDQRRSGGLIRA